VALPEESQTLALGKKDAQRYALVSGPLKCECLCRCCTSPFSITPNKRFAEYADEFPSLCAQGVQHGVTVQRDASIKTLRASHFRITEQLRIVRQHFDDRFVFSSLFLRSDRRLRRPRRKPDRSGSPHNRERRGEQSQRYGHEEFSTHDDLSGLLDFTSLMVRQAIRELAGVPGKTSALVRLGTFGRHLAHAIDNPSICRPNRGTCHGDCQAHVCPSPGRRE
jgi:hypothetical protein